MPKSAPFILIVSAMSISGCSALAPEPTVTSTATATNTPVPTATLTLTPEPTATETPPPPTDTPEPAEVALDPQGTPDAGWNGIPIMPDAVAGEGDNSGYMFRVNATTEEVIDFYDRELTALGYSSFATGDAENGNVIALYQKGVELLTVSVIEQGDGCVIVLIL